MYCQSHFIFIETEDNIDLVIDHAQIDNMASWENPVLFCPKKLLANKEGKAEENKGEDEEEYTPFVQLSKQIFVIKFL